MPEPKQSPDGPASAPAATPETLSAVLADYRADIPAMTSGELPHPTPEYLRILLDRIERAAKREYEEAKDYFAKLHDGPSMVCTAKNCALRNAAEDIVEQVEAEASLGHFAPVVVEDRAVGNAAALREALKAIDGNTDLLDIAEGVAPNLHPSHSFVAVQIRKIARAALAAPPRNCDRFQTAEEALAEIEKQLFMWNPTLYSVVQWLFAPAEGGAK